MRSFQGDVQLNLSLTYSANGDNYEAIERCLKCLKLCRITDNVPKEVGHKTRKHCLGFNFVLNKIEQVTP